MRGPVMGGHVAVLGLDQHVMVLIDENGAEWMIAMGHGAAGDFERPAQKKFVEFRSTQIGYIGHQCPAMCRPISVRSASLARAS